MENKDCQQMVGKKLKGQENQKKTIEFLSIFPKTAMIGTFSLNYPI